MSAWSVWLRVFLSIGLILNGSGWAKASVASDLRHPSSAPHVATPTAADELATLPPCHQQVDEATGARAGPSGDATRSGGASEPDESLEDCCTDAGCGCGCLHPAHAIVPLLAPGPLPALQGATQRARAKRHLAPSLVHPTRPPIG